MIKANELRIGNYVFDNLKQWIIQMHSANGILNVEQKPSEYNPVEITEEILLKLGFKCEEKTRENIYRLNIFEYATSCKTIDLEIDYFDNHATFTTDIKYVHQLQNLFFFLTGEELVFSTTEP